MVGVEQGIFLKHGIDAKLVTAPAGTAATQALISGQYQVIVTAWATTAPAILSGTPMKVFSLVTGGPAVNYDNQLAIVLRPGLTATSITDLKGLKIASVLGTSPEIWLRTRLKAAGMNPDKDVQIISVPYANMQGVLQTAAADAAVPVEPYGTLITTLVSGTKVMVRGGGIIDGRQLLAATSTWIAQNPKLVDQMIAANYEAAQYVRQHPDETATAVSHYVTGIDIPVLKEALKTIAYDPRWADTVGEGLTRTSQLLVDAGTIKTSPSTNDALALDLLKASPTKYAQYTTDLK
jgi:NitT/TauT family transport system substrate-binding protein